MRKTELLRMDRVRREVARYRGRVVDTTPDGALALFDGPARAVRAADAIRSEPADLERDRRPLAHRYLGAQEGDRYIEKTRLEYADNVVVRMLPERWLTVDYAKAGPP